MLPRLVAERLKEITDMEKYLEMKEFAESLGIKTAFVQVLPGESDQEAWNRHLKENPDDAMAMLKIFNQPQPAAA